MYRDEKQSREVEFKKRRFGNLFLGSNVKACLMKCEALTSLYTGVSGSLVSSVTLIIHCENQCRGLWDNFLENTSSVWRGPEEKEKSSSSDWAHHGRVGFFQSVSGADSENY